MLKLIMIQTNRGFVLEFIIWFRGRFKAEIFPATNCELQMKGNWISNGTRLNGLKTKSLLIPAKLFKTTHFLPERQFDDR